MTLYVKSCFKQIPSIFFLLHPKKNAFVGWAAIHAKMSDKEVFLRTDKNMILQLLAQRIKEITSYEHICETGIEN